MFKSVNKLKIIIKMVQILSKQSTTVEDCNIIYFNNIRTNIYVISEPSIIDDILQKYIYIYSIVIYKNNTILKV